MICLTLFLVLFAAVVTGTAEQSDPYLIYAIEGEDKDLSFYKTDFNFQNTENILTSTGKKAVATWYIEHDENGDVLYSSYKDSDVITSLNVSSRETREVTINGASKGEFLGPLRKETLMFSFTEGNEMQIQVFNFESNASPIYKKIGNKKIHPEKCSQTSSSEQIVDLDNRNITSVIELSECPQRWTLSSDKKSYTINGLKLYSLENQIFSLVYTFDEEVNEFAVGIDVIFFTTDEYGKIFKLTKGKDGEFSKTEHSVDGKVTALVVEQLSPLTI